MKTLFLDAAAAGAAVGAAAGVAAAASAATSDATTVQDSAKKHTMSLDSSQNLFFLIEQIAVWAQVSFLIFTSPSHPRPLPHPRPMLHRRALPHSRLGRPRTVTVS